MVFKRVLAGLAAVVLAAGALGPVGIAEAAGKRPPAVVVAPGYPPPGGYSGVIQFPPSPPPRRRRAPPPVAALPIPRGMLELVFAGESNAIYVSARSLRRTVGAADLTMLMIPVRIGSDGLSFLVGRVHADCVRRTVRVTVLSGYRDNGALLGTSTRSAAPPMGVGSGGYRLLERACDEDADALRLRLDGPEDARQVTRRGMDTLAIPPDGFGGSLLSLPAGRLAGFAVNTLGGADFVDLDSIRPDGGGFRARILRVVEVSPQIRGGEAALIVTEVKVDCGRKRAWIHLMAFFDANRRYITQMPGEGPDLPGLDGLTPLAFGIICGIDKPADSLLAYGVDEAVALSRKTARREHGRLAS